ncbi:MAG: hypothetical protein ACJAWV_000448 [Flammeovirgaceae bacterium]|jgi:hypothetical protein
MVMVLIAQTIIDTQNPVEQEVELGRGISLVERL